MDFNPLELFRAKHFSFRETSVYIYFLHTICLVAVDIHIKSQFFLNRNRKKIASRFLGKIAIAKKSHCSFLKKSQSQKNRITQISLSRKFLISSLRRFYFLRYMFQKCRLHRQTFFLTFS